MRRSAPGALQLSLLLPCVRTGTLNTAAAFASQAAFSVRQVRPFFRGPASPSQLPREPLTLREFPGTAAEYEAHRSKARLS